MRWPVVALLLLAACGQALATPPPAMGTVTGSVVIAPCRPVERPGDPPCPPRAGVGVQFQLVAGGPKVTTQTDATGTYSVKLAPGDYEARSEGGIGPGRSSRVTVVAGQSVRLDFTVDSGIR